jgi:CheY-like chemotaxis protein
MNPLSRDRLKRLAEIIAMQIPQRRGMLLLALALCWAGPLYAEDPGAAGPVRSVEPGQFLLQELPPLVEKQGMSDFEKQLVNQVQTELGFRSPPPQKIVQSNLILTIFLVAAGAIALRKVGAEIRNLLGTPLAAGATGVPAAAAPDYVDNDPAFAAFVSSFQIAPSRPESGCDSGWRRQESREKDADLENESKQPASSITAGNKIHDETQWQADSLQRFFQSSPRQIVAARNLFCEISRSSDPAERQTKLGDLVEQIGALKESSSLPELLPFWQAASALESLLKQIRDKPSNVTPSTLRTAAAALDLLDALCVPGLDPDLAKDPPIRLLVVDDDPISRHAVSFSLKKAFAQPDVAPEGQAALSLTEKQTYDVIFLDVEMPGMDGFEICSRIHALGPNRATPVVFVTSQGDFESRTQSALTGGQDLIAKPFLTFEITVKALTLVLKGRLGAGAGLGLGLPPSPELAPEKEKSINSGEISNQHSTAPESGPVPSACARQGGQSSPSVTDSITDTSFFRQAETEITGLRNQLRGVDEIQDQATRQQRLGDLCRGVQSLAHQAGRAELSSIDRLGLALEGLLKKLRDRPQHVNTWTLNTAATALELLDDLCGAGVDLNLTSPPLRLLVVDDDPVARRALSGALQLSFGRPENAGTGEQAVEMANQGVFDVIFLDVCMPGMDGYEACARIRKSEANSLTPIVFVTSRNDLESRDQAGKAGANGFIPKPVLPIEVTVQALTFALRARLQKIESSLPRPDLEPRLTAP